jgi:thiol-disulfide isomerase/thioredoxin
VTAGRRFIALLVAVTGVLAACGGDSTGQVGDPLPDVEIHALTDDTVRSLADIEGPAVVNLWATWCAPCRAEIPAFEEVHQARGDGVRFIGVNIGDAPDAARKFLDDVGASYDQYLDPDGYVVTELGTTNMPVTFVIADDGAITTRHLGAMTADDLNAAIDEALGT